MNWLYVKYVQECTTQVLEYILGVRVCYVRLLGYLLYISQWYYN